MRGVNPHKDDRASNLVKIVQDRYADVARRGPTGETAAVRNVAAAFGYSSEDLEGVPDAANMGLSCGNPVALASLAPGEVVVDLGCGGGLDVLVAARKVGPTGRVIGIDMTPEMVELARRNARRAGLDNVEILNAHIDALPLPDASVDCVISNCVINLAPDKPAVFREIFRVLKPGGRAAVSDIALKKELPPDLARSVEAYVGCIAGAISIEDYMRGLEEAGFSAIDVVDIGADLNVYAEVGGGCGTAVAGAEVIPNEPSPGAGSSPEDDVELELCCAPGCCGGGAPSSPAIHESLAEIVARYDINQYAASIKAFAVKSL